MDFFSRCNELAKKGVGSEGMLSRLGRFWTLCKAGTFLIRDIHAELVPLRPNLAQSILHRAMMEQALLNKPIRVTILKARKEGISTWIQVLYSYLCAYYPNQNAVTIAHTGESTNEIFDIARRAAQHHSEREAEILHRTIRWEDGSKYYSMTAGGAAVGAGGTPSAVHLSEGPKWERNKRETFYNMLNALPMTPSSIAASEFTAKGRDLFFEHWDKSSEPGSGYTPIFLAWYMDERCSVPTDEPIARNDEEIKLAARAYRDSIELTDGMFQWRRLKIREIGADMFRQEYPSTPEEAVAASEGLIMPGMRDCIIDELPFDFSSVAPEEMVGGIDFGYSDPCVIGSGVYRDQVLYIMDIWRQTESLAEEQLEALIPFTTYWCDPANPSERNELSRLSERQGSRVQLLKAPRRRSPGEDIATLELKRVVRMAEEGRILILRSASEQLIRESDSLAWNKASGKPDMSRAEGVGHYDTIMMLKYWVMGLENWKILSPPSRKSQQSRKKQFSGI